MVSVGLQLMGYVLGMLGLLGTVITTLLPNWKNSSYIGASIVTAVGFTKGLWMECAIFSTGITQCDIYNSLLSLPPDTQAAQALMVTSSAVSSLACLVTAPGMKCTIFAQGSRAKDRVAVTGGVIFILGGVLCFIPIVWNMHVVLQDFYNPLLPDSTKYEMGEALYLGIVSAFLSVVGGCILSASCPPREPEVAYQSAYPSKLPATRSSQPSISQPQKTKSEFSAYNLTGYV